MFLIGNQILLFMKTSVIVIVIGLYYGFLTVFSIGPSFIFLIRSRVMEEGTEKEVSATTGFIAGQLLNFIAIYYTPLYKTLDRPHLITILVIPYIFFILFYANNKKDSDYLKSNSIHNLSIQFAFFNNLSSQLLNHFSLPSSALNRLVNIYLFQYNNKILFLTSSFCGWLIGHLLFLKNIGSILFWIKHNYYFRYQRNKYILSNKYILTEFRNDINRIFSIFFYFILVFYLGRMPLPFFTRKLLDTEEVKIIKDEYLFEINSDIKEKETDDIKIRYLNDTQIYKDYNLEITKNIKNILEEDKIKINLWFENIFITFLFDYKRWNRPLRYIKNYQFDNFFRKEMSQFFFFTGTNDGKKRIYFTYPYSLSIFLENMYKKNYLYISEKFSDEYIFNSWIYTNEKKKSNLDNEILKRIKKLEINNNRNTKEKENIFNILEKRTLLCDDKKQIKYLPNLYDPFFNGPNRINRNKLLSISYQDIDNKSVSGRFLINNIYNILSNYYFKLSHNLVFSSNREISYNMEKSIFSYPENTIKYFKFLFDLIREYEELIKNKYFIIRLNKINKYISRWSYKLKERLEEEEEDNEDEFEEEGIVDINSRKFKHIIIYKDNNQDTNEILIADNLKNKDKNEDRIDEVTLIHYSNKSDFRRNLIKGSMRAQRRKIVILDLFQVNAHSPLFLDRLTTTFYINEIENILNIFFNKFIDMKMEKKLHLKFYDFKKLNVKEKEYKDKYEHIEINETWDNPLFTQVIRSLMLVIQSYFRKYILLPFLIIVKNLVRILLFQIPEWDKDFKEWAKEMHIKCTYNGVQLSETEFPEDWLIEGIQIKIIYPFCLKPCRRDKTISYNIEIERKKKKNKRPQSFFLTVWGGETEHLFGSTRKQSFILNPIYKKLKKKYKIVKNIFLEIKYFLKNKIFNFLKVRKKKENIFYESSVLSQTKNGFNSYLFQLNITDVSDKARKIRKQTEQIVKEKNSKIQYYKDEVLKSYINFWMILINKKRRLIRKSYYFIKLFIEKLYIDILLWIITFYKIKVQLFFESKKSFINFKMSIYKEKKEKDVLYEITKNTRNFILIIKEIFLNNRYIDKIKNNYPNFNYIFSYFSQAYVFYKLSQDQPHSLIFIKPFKNNYKESCILENIFIYKLKNTKYNKINIDVTNYWFKGFFKSKIEEKVRLGNYERHNLNYNYNLNKSKELIKTDKEYFIKDYYKLDYLVKKNISKYTKNYRYDILLNKYIGNYISTLIIKIKRKKKGQEIKENLNKSKYKLFYTYLNRYIPYNTKKIRSDNTINRTNLLYKKYFDYKSIHLNCINYRNKNILSISNFKPWFFIEFVRNFDVYKKKPWIIPIKSLLFNIYKKSKSTNKNIISYKDLIRLESKSSMETGQDVNNKGVELDFFLKNSLLFQLRWVDYLNKRIIKNIKVYCLLLRIINPKDIYISSIQRSEIKIDDMLIQKDLVTAEFINNGILFFEPIFISIQKGGEHIIYQVLDISLNNKNNRKYRISDNYKNKEYINNKSTNNYFFNVEKKNNYEVLFPENILSLKRRREFRFRSCLNPFNISNKKKKFCNDKIIILNLLQTNKSFDKLSIYFIYLKMFLWPNYRLEDIACINRYWFNTNNSSRFSMLKINMYSKLRKSIIIDK